LRRVSPPAARTTRSSIRQLLRLLPTEAYIARTDTYIEKDSSRNDDIDRMRHSTTQNLLTRRDVLVVASVSCIYGIGSVEDYMGESLTIEKGQSIRRESFCASSPRCSTSATTTTSRGCASRARRRRDLVPANEEKVYRVEFFGDEVERIQELDAVTGEILGAKNQFTVFPRRTYVTPADKLRLAMADIEAELEERCRWFETTAPARGPATAPAHQLRPRDAARDGHLRRDRETTPGI